MPDQEVQFEGATHIFPADFSQQDISKALASLHPQAQVPSTETFVQGLKSTLPIGGTGFGPMARIRDAVGATLGQLSSMKDAYDKAADAHAKGRDFEALTHLVGVIPFIGPGLHHAGETLGGTEAQYDKFGNIIKPGLQPNPAGAAGETLGLTAPALVDTGARVPGAAGTIATAAREALTKPGTGKILLGGGETAAGGAALLHGNLWGMYPLARGMKTLGKGLSERAAAKAAEVPAQEPVTPPLAGKIPPLVPGQPQPAGLTPTDLAKQELTPTPEAAAAAAEHQRLLDGIAVGQKMGPSYAALPVGERALVDRIATGIEHGLSPEQTAGGPPPGRIGPLYPAAPTAQPASQAQPTPSPVPAAEAVPEAVAPPAQPPAPEPPAAPPQPTVRPGESPAEALFREAQASGTVPATAKPGEPFGGTVPNPEPFQQAARGKRAATAETLTNAFRDYGLSSEDLRDMQPKEWATTADALGIEFPKTAPARQKLIDATIQRFEAGGTATIRARRP